jgi:hypothetical protein
MTERYYSCGIDGELTARDGVGGVKRRLFSPGSVFGKPTEGGVRHAGGSIPDQLAFRLLADALGSETRASATQDYFSRRVMPLLPARWTMTRSRIYAYVEMIEHEELAGLGPGNQTTS